MRGNKSNIKITF